MRIAPKYRRGILGLSLAAAAASAQAPPQQDAELEDIASLESLAKSEAARQFPPLTERQRFLIGPIEPRLQLARCRQPVRAALTSAHHMRDRATVELRCQDAKSWHLYVQVRVIGTSTVAVAAHAIVAGSVLKAADLRVEEHDVSELPLGFLDDPAIAVGLTASRPIPGGALSHQSAIAGRQGGAARPVGDPDGRSGWNECAHGRQGTGRRPGKSKG